jgi:hypothetical protein
VVVSIPDLGRDAQQLALEQLLARFAAERRRRTEDNAPADIDPLEYRVSPLCYPGLRSFDPSEDQFFFGRRRNVTEIRRKLAAERIVVVQGGSGTGKSSVIRAGLIPRLRDTDTMKGRHGNWYAAEFRPRTDPLGNLAEGLADLVARKFVGQPADLTENTAGESKDSTEIHSLVRDRLADRFGQASRIAQQVADPNDQRAARAWALLNALRDFAFEVDARDKLATEGLRAGPANLLLLVDQFEEVFRPEALASGGQLLDLLIAAHTFLTQTPEGQACGLFIVVTMRTEELHRVGEYPALTLPTDLSVKARRSVTLADVVTSSFYLIQVMDPDQDKADLKDAIVRPAREVLDDYGLLDQNRVDAPFDDGVVDWLLDGARIWRDAVGQGHKADQLPLLQHALRSMWENALDRWNLSLRSGTMPAILITKNDLPQGSVDRHTERIADLAYCLDARADRARNEAAIQFGKAIASGESAADPTAAGNAALRAAIRALARRDDRGNWARRFATIDAMDAFLAIDPETSSLPVQNRRQALTRALHVLKADGYLSEGRSQEYDISHEALIRNWGTALAWLREPSDTALAIERVLKDVDPSLIGQPDKVGALEELMPKQLVERLAPIEDPQSPLAPAKPVVCLPPEWSKEQIRLVVGINDNRSGWGSVDAAFEKLRDARRQVIRRRLRWASQETRRLRQRRMLQIGLPALAIGILCFMALLLNGYQQVKEIAAGSWVLAEAGYISSARSLTDTNSHRLKGIAFGQDYLRERRYRPPPDGVQLMRATYGSLDFAARYALGASLTPVSLAQTQPNVGVKCWYRELKANLGEIAIGGTGIRAQLQIESGNAKLIVAGDTRLGGKEIEWDPQQVGSFQDAAKLPPNGRVCITVNGSTLILTTPSTSLIVISVLWETSGDKIVMRGWPVSLFSGSQEPGLACVRGVYESARGTAVVTQVIYGLYRIEASPDKDCAEAISRNKAMAFVRGLLTPVALPRHGGGVTDAILKCRQLPSSADQMKNESTTTAVWSCGERASAWPIKISIAEWPNSASDAGRGAMLSLADTREDEILSGSFVIDEAVIPRDATPSGLDLALACSGDSISLLISDKNVTPDGRGQTWAYLVGAKAIRDLLREIGSLEKVKEARPNQGDPIALVEGAGDTSFSAWILEASARNVDGMRNSVAQLISPQRPPPLCSAPAIDGRPPADRTAVEGMPISEPLKSLE